MKNYQDVRDWAKKKDEKYSKMSTEERSQAWLDGDADAIFNFPAITKMSDADLDKISKALEKIKL